MCKNGGKSSGGGGKSSGGGGGPKQTASQINRSVQLKPNHATYWSSRGVPAPSANRVEVAKEAKAAKK